MSTRSGKRLHNSFHDVLIKSDLEDAAKSEKKTRGKRLKENVKETASVFKSKKRNNYVSYPTDDEQGTDRDDLDPKEEGLITRSLRNNTLKERNTIHISSNTVAPEDSRKSTRNTRKTRKFPEVEPQKTDTTNNEAPKHKKTKKKKSDSHEDVSKKMKKKKGKKRSTSIVVEDIEPIVKNHMNKSTASIDSFYSAAGSPENVGVPEDIEIICNNHVDTFETEPAETRPVIEGRQTRSGKQPNNITQSQKMSRKRKFSGITKDKTLDDTLIGNKHKQRKSSVTTTRDLVDDKPTEILNDVLISDVNTITKSMKDQEIDETESKFNETFERDSNLNVSKMSNRRSTRKSKINDTYEKTDNISPTDETTNKSIEVNTTFDKNNGKKLVKDTTFEKNITFENDPDSFDNRQSIKNSTFNKDTAFEQENENFQKTATVENSNNTFEKRQSIKNSTFNKDATFEKDSDSTSNKRKSVKDSTFDKNTTFEKDSNDTFDKRQSIKNSTFNKDGTFEKDSDSTSKKRKSIKDSTFDKNTTFEKDSNETFDKRQSIKNSTFNKDATFEKDSDTNKSKSLKDSTFDKNTTFEKDSNDTFDKRKSMKDTTFDKSFDKDNIFDKRKSTKDITFDKNIVDYSEIEIIRDSTFDKKSMDTEAKDLTFEKDPSPIQKQRKSIICIDKEITTEQNTFEKSKSSLISSDNSNITSDVSRISITSDDSNENIVNMTPVLIESSIDESAVTKILQSPDSTTKTPQPVTPLKREGTFTKDESEICMEILSKTPTKQLSLSSPGCTPFPHKISNNKPLNLTRSIEKRRSSLADVLPRTTKVMFCSPINNPAVVMQQRRKVIKSNLKGSNKSFVFEEDSMTPRAGARRKRSYTVSDADDAGCKRKRFADEVQHSIDRLARPRTFSANAKLTEPTTPSKKSTPSKAKISRTKLPNFAALHQKQFDKMESLDECQERRARRARQLLTPTGAVSLLERTSPRDAEQRPKEPETKPKQIDLKPKESETKPKESEIKPKQTETKPKESGTKPKEFETKLKEPRTKQKDSQTKRKESQTKPKESETKPKESETKPKKPETPIKSLPTLKSLNPGYSRFGFRLNLDVNPFVSSKTDVKPKDKRPILVRQATLPGFTRETTLPSVAGATSSRREEAKRTVMREKSFTDKRNINRKENRTIIKGVRTNRRFELQMRMRNIE